MKYLFVKDSLSAENEYHLDENGDFVPGTLTKEEGKKYLMKWKKSPVIFQVEEDAKGKKM